MLQLKNASKTYRSRGQTIHALTDLSLKLDPGDFAVVHGPSGSGKSTLLFLAGGMLPPDSGDVTFDGDRIYKWSPHRRNKFRNQSVGFIFQRFHLVPYLSVSDNIRLPLALKRGKRPSKDAVKAIAERLQIGHRLQHRPSELSVGEQQRAAIARAIIGDKRLILADEPTGNLDTDNAAIVTDVLKQESAEGRIVMMVTHNPDLMGIGNKTIKLKNGSAGSAN